MTSARQQHYSVVVVGAGPAGLSLGYELMQWAVPPNFVILESGGVPGASWRQMPRSLKLLSPWRENTLSGSPSSVRQAYSLRPASDFADYLSRYAVRHGLPVITNSHVKRVIREGAFSLQTSTGVYTADLVVNATGYNMNPYIPSYPGLGSTAIQQLHVRDFVDAHQVARLTGKPEPKVLVVGKRVSAGQAIVDLHCGGAEVVVSHRTPIVFARHPVVLRAVFPFYFPWEDARVRISPFYREDSHPPMEGGLSRKLIRSGQVRSRPNIARCEAREVVFEDGSREAFDLILFATGFRPALGHLQDLLPHPSDLGPPIRGMEAADVPGLFFLGLDRLRTFRSRYLRGIREDARALAALLEERIGGSVHHQELPPADISNVANMSVSVSSRLIRKNRPEGSS